MEKESYELYQKLLECEDVPMRVIGSLSLEDYFRLVEGIFSAKCMDYFGNTAVYSMFRMFEVIRQDLFKDQPSFILINHSINNKINLKDYLNIPRTSSFINIVNSTLNIVSGENKLLVSNLFAIDSKVNIDNLIFSEVAYTLLNRTELNIDHKRSFPIWGVVRNFLRFWDEDDSTYYSRQYRIVGDSCSLSIKSSVYIGSNCDFYFLIPIFSCNNKINIDLTNFKYAAVKVKFYDSAENNEINIIADPRRVTIEGNDGIFKLVNKITLNGENYE